MDPVREQSIISKHLHRYGIEHEELERLIAIMYRRQYHHLIPGAPGGGTDLGIDIMYTDDGNSATVWCITAQEEKPMSKLTSDAITVLQTVSQWNFKKLETIYLCTCRKVNNKKWSDSRAIVLEERDKLITQGVSSLSETNLVKVDCDTIAVELTTSDLLKPLKEALLNEIRAGVGLPYESLSHLGPGLPGEDDTGESLDEMQSEWEEEIGNWSQLYKQVIDSYTGIETVKNEAAILAAVADLGRLVGTTQGIGFDWREKQLPGIRKKLNERLWPTMIHTWNNDPLLAEFDIRLATCALYTNLALLNRMFSLNLSEVERVHRFIIGNAAVGRLIRQEVTCKLITLLLWLNHRFERFHEVLELRDVAYRLFFIGKGQYTSTEEHNLLVNLARLYIQAVKYGEGDTDYRQKLFESFIDGLNIMQEGFWRQSLSLMGLLYDRRATVKWAVTREQFINGFQKIKLDQVNTAKKAAAYLELYARYLELIGTTGRDACRQKLDRLTHLIRQVGKDVRLRLHRLLLELGTCFTCSWHELPDRFLALENSVLREASSLGNVWGLIVKTRMLSLFVFRILDPRVLGQERFLNQSDIISHLLTESETKSLGLYFGIPDFKVDNIPKGKAVVFERIRGTIRPLISHGLANYSNMILPNQSLPSGTLARATLDYIDFLTQANALHPDLQISTVFWDLIGFLEDKANDITFFYYYLSRIYYKHYLRDIPKVLEHFTQFWQAASDFEKNRFAGEYARILYEYHMYFERDEGEEASLQKLLQIGHEFLGADNRQHFISCYYGLALILNGSKNSSQSEAKFLDELARWISNLGGKYRPSDRDYYQNLIAATVYTTEFHDFLRRDQGYIANSLLASLDSPEIYNAIATYLLHTLKPNLSHDKLIPIKLLYDIAVGLARNQEYYLPKYQFNRIRCDFFEIESMGVPRNQSDIQLLISTIDNLHKLGPRFPWARKFLQKEVCLYLCQYHDEPSIHQVLNHEHFGKYWGTLRKVVQKRLGQL